MKMRIRVISGALVHKHLTARQLRSIVPSSIVSTGQSNPDVTEKGPLLIAVRERKYALKILMIERHVMLMEKFTVTATTSLSIRIPTYRAFVSQDTKDKMWNRFARVQKDRIVIRRSALLLTFLINVRQFTTTTKIQPLVVPSFLDVRTAMIQWKKLTIDLRMDQPPHQTWNATLEI